MTSDSRRRLTLLALGSSVATLGPVLTAGAAFATGPVVGTVTETLSAPDATGVTVDGSGNLTFTGSYHGTVSPSVTVDVAYTDTGMDGAQVTCGESAPVRISGDSYNGVVACTYDQVGAFTVVTASSGTDYPQQVAKATVTFHDTDPAVPTVDDTLGGTLDAHGDSTVVASGGSAALPVQWSASAAARQVGSAPNTLTSLTLACGNPGETPAALIASATAAASGTTDCHYTQAGTYHVTLSTTDAAGLSASLTRNVTVTVPAAPQNTVDRYDGMSRYGTGVALSQASYPTAGSAQAVVLARGDVFADALAGIPLAKLKNGPLLLTPGGAGVTALDPNVETELLRILPRDKSHTVYLLGGVGAIPQVVEDHIANDLGYNVVRLSGGDRFATALAVAKDPRAMNSPGNVVVARGDDFADALAAGPYAANADKDGNGVPAAIVLSDGPAASASLSADTAAFVASRLAGSHVTAVGGGAVAAVAALPGSTGNYKPASGQDRYQTAYAVARLGWTVPQGAGGLQFVAIPVIGVASGSSFADALTGGAYMAAKNGPLLLTSSPDLADPVMWTVKAGLEPGGDIAVFGGPGVLAPSIVSTLVADAGTTLSSYHDHHVAF